MDNLLHSLREPPDPAFAAGLKARLLAAERRRARQAVVRRTIATLAVGLSILVALNLGLLVRRAPQQNNAVAHAGVLQQIPASELILPATQTEQYVVANSSLKAPPTPVSHHH